MRLTIRTALWRSHVASVASAVEGLVPVVKGNGYGFGRAWLAETAAEFADTLAVGTVHELDHLPLGGDARRADPAIDPQAILAAQTSAVRTDPHRGQPRPHRRPRRLARPGPGQAGVVDAALRSIRRRLPTRWSTRRQVRASTWWASASILRSSGRPAEHGAEIAALVGAVDPSLPVWVSHLDARSYAALPSTHAYRLRLGTLLWHGDKSMLHLYADVLDVRQVHAGARVGYRLGTVATDGHVVMIGAGTAHGLAAVDPPAGRARARSTSSGAASSCTRAPTCTRRCASSPTGCPSRGSATVWTCSVRSP